MSKVFVGMSGGVDSSVAALLLQQQGHTVTGVYMKNWSQDLPGLKCPWADDLADAKRVAVRLGIPFEVWDFEAAYREKVVEYMLAEFRAGRTPNPDIMCNQEIKFKLFYERARQQGADFIATGHYARVVKSASPQQPAGTNSQNYNVSGASTGQYRAQHRRTRCDFDDCRPRTLRAGALTTLARAVDENKDQTYFLYRISDEALQHTIFPIGEMLKPDVKRLAADHGLHNAYKKESMGVCFVGEVGMKDFLKEYIDIQPGEIREAETDRVLGYHEGAVFYTIGQRHGLYLSGAKGTANDGLPYYIVMKDLAKNLLYVSKNLNHTALWATDLRLRDIIIRTGDGAGGGPTPRAVSSTVGEEEAAGPVQSVSELPRRMVQVRLRHRAPLIPATFDGETLYFDKEVKRPASGQSAVLYDGAICLGGGIIA